MTDLIWRVILPGSEDLRLFAESEERVSYWEHEVARRFGLFGPKSAAYQNAERNLIQSHVDAGNWSEALRLALDWEKRHSGQLTDNRAENFLALGRCFLGLRKFVEAREVLSTLLRSTEQPIFGQWTLYYHIHAVTLFADYLHAAETKALDEESMRYLAFLKSKQGLGDEITLTVEMRLLLALCQERRGDLDHALSNYRQVYQFFKQRELFPAPACRTGLLARIYRMQKRKNQEAASIETRMWIKNLLKEHPELEVPTRRYIDAS
jgi:tetratricopeptide (TPR) repeat protein